MYENAKAAIQIHTTFTFLELRNNYFQRTPLSVTDLIRNQKMNVCNTNCSKNSNNSKEHVYSELFFAENADSPTFIY